MATARRPLVFIESPYSGEIDRNIRYLLLCTYDCWVRGEFAVSSHGNMTQHPAKRDFFVSDYDLDWNVYTRETAIEGAHALRHACSQTVFYDDLGWSTGMKEGRAYCDANSIPYEIRKLNVANVMAMNARLISKPLIEAILQHQPYEQFLEGSPLLPTGTSRLSAIEACERLLTLPPTSSKITITNFSTRKNPR